MARIAIGICGEGLGHAARACAVIERLGSQHEILVASTSEVTRLVAGRCAAAAGRLRFIDVPGIRFQYSAGRLDVARTIGTGLWYRWRRVPAILARVVSALERFDTEIVVTDFEPVMARAAHRIGLPLVSVDHQHFLIAYDLGCLPRGLRWEAACMGLAVRMYVRRAADTVVSSFFRPPLRRGWEHVVQVGPLLRRAVLTATPRADDFVLSYLRPHTPPAAIEALASCGMPVRAYGLGARDGVGSVTFHAIDEARFVGDLAGCAAVVAAGGNQLIGEAIHLGKPVLALPESAHAEQMMNGYFLRHQGCGDFVPLERIDGARIRAFLAALERHASALATFTGQMDGTETVVRLIERRLAALDVAGVERAAAA